MLASLQNPERWRTVGIMMALVLHLEACCGLPSIPGFELRDQAKMQEALCLSGLFS